MLLIESMFKQILYKPTLQGWSIFYWNNASIEKQNWNMNQYFLL